MTSSTHLRPCLECGEPTRSARCDLCSSDPGYATRHWHEVRAVTLSRAGYACQLRHRGCTVMATSVHLDPSLDGDHRFATPDVCVATCLHCHGVEDAPRSKRTAA